MTTAGLGDLLWIGDQARPDLFALEIVKPAPLFETSIEIDERILADGTVERSPDLVLVRQQMVDLRSSHNDEEWIDLWSSETSNFLSAWESLTGDDLTDLSAKPDS